MPQIALVAHKHNHNIRIGMIAQLFQPACDVLICLVLRDVVDKQRAHSTTVVCAGDSTVALLPCCVPDLCFDGFGVDLDTAGSELDADCGLAVEIELVASESGEEVGLSNAGVADKDYFEEKLVRVG
jgi:hypothetical protein